MIIPDGFSFLIPIILPSRKEQIKSQPSYHVFGIATRNGTTTISPQSPPVVNSNAQVEPNIKDEPQRLESNAKEEQEMSTFNSDNNNRKMREEIENLGERIMERVEKSLEEKGIELNPP